MQLQLPKSSTLQLNLMESVNLSANTAVTALLPGQSLPDDAPRPGIAPVEVPMTDWGDYDFKNRLKVRVNATGQIGFLDRAVVIDLWFSPLIPGTVADLWCTWQLTLINSPIFGQDFRQRIQHAMSGGESADVARAMAALMRRVPKLKKLSPLDVADIRNLGGNPVILFRFYTGERHGLLPTCLKPRYPFGTNPDPLALLNEEEPKAPARRTQAGSAQVHPVSMPQKKSHLTRVKAGGGAFQADQRATSATVDSTSHGAAAHGQGFTQDSPYVSAAISLPNLLATSSSIVKVIIYGRDVIGGPAEDVAQATHLGVFLVPANKWACEVEGYESKQEREVLYKGFAGGSGYEGLWEYELFTLPNPFRAGGRYNEAYNVAAVNAFFA